MYINVVVEHLGAWSSLQDNGRYPLRDIEAVLASLSDETLVASKEKFREAQVSLGKHYKALRELFEKRAWKRNPLVQNPGSPRKYQIDFVRGGIGLELCLGKQAFAIHSLFVNFPLLVSAGRIRIGVLLIPMKSLNCRPIFGGMVLLKERPEYDFKIDLPTNKKLAQEICGFANLQGGGIILFGIDDDGTQAGIHTDDVDGLAVESN
jgi:hypothetical protein